MASSKPIPCGPCKEGKVNTQADIWCYNCDEGLCSTCSSHHKRIKSSRDHKTIDIQTYTSYKPPTGLIKSECEAHSQQFNLYCPSHLMPCCDECISTSHSKYSERTSEVDIKIKQNGESEKILKELQLIKSFGEVTVVNTEISLKRQTSVSREAQIELQEQSNIENMTMNIETTIPINISKLISDIICLMDGRVIVVEQMGKVNLLTSDGKFEKQLPISGEPWGVSQINLDNIAVTSDNNIEIFNMKTETVTKVIKLNEPCTILSFSNNSLAVGSCKDEIRIIDLEGNTLKSMQVESKSHLFHIVYCKDGVIYSDYHDKTVYCVNESGKKIWQHKHDLSGPRGLFVDTYGNIFVADFGSGSVKVISKDGQNSKILVRKRGSRIYAVVYLF
ncbi:unnamed protein product [Mytilus edulis]|uniref:B box-type domain-containing protein n=1 Tax=Mytilus edulis TaxID=6550 RepID=A0A8S3QDD1_MYTED|nr:unnamed protein product [Mytilus edulis]